MIDDSDVGVGVELFWFFDDSWLYFLKINFIIASKQGSTTGSRSEGQSN